MLEELGLSSSAAALYRLLVSRGPMAVSAVPTITGMRDADVAQGVDELRSMGLLIRPRDPRLTPVSPQVASQILMARQEAELAEMKSRVERAQTVADDLVATYGSPSAHNGLDVEHVVGAEAIWTRVAELCREDRREIATFSPNGPLAPAAIAASRAPNRDLLERGIRSRTIYLNSIRGDEQTMDHVGWLRDHGSEVRTVPTLPVRMMIHDQRVAVLPIDPDNGLFGIAIVRQAGAVLAAQALFEQVWATAVPLGAPVQSDEHGLTPDERAVLTLLAEGLTDDAIARRLAVSPRTARRITGGLVERLGARSRFEAGVLAARRGWLD